MSKEKLAQRFVDSIILWLLENNGVLDRSEAIERLQFLIPEKIVEDEKSQDKFIAGLRKLRTALDAHDEDLGDLLELATKTIPFQHRSDEFQRRKLALRLVEYIDSWIQRNGDLDVDAAAKELACLIPSTRIELEEEFEELLQDTSDVNNNPGTFAQLSEALGLEDCSIVSVLKSATEVVQHNNEVSKNPYDAGLFKCHGIDTGRWHDYIRYLLTEAHDYYTGGNNE